MYSDNASRIRKQPRFSGIFENQKGFEKRIALTSQIPIDINRNLMKALEDGNSTNFIAELERRIALITGSSLAVATDSWESAIHTALELAIRRIFGVDILAGKRVFCSDLCQIGQTKSILDVYGIPVFIDVSDYDLCMDPECLEIAFDTYPETKIVIMNHFCGYPGQIAEIKRICHEHNAILIENLYICH